MAIASLLARTHEVTIVARDLPGDDLSIDWASPWAGASFVAGGVSTSREKKMQIDTFAELWRMSISHPESSLKRITMEEFHEDLSEDDVWWKDYMPQVRFPTPIEFRHCCSKLC